MWVLFYHAHVDVEAAYFTQQQHMNMLGSVVNLASYLESAPLIVVVFISIRGERCSGVVEEVDLEQDRQGSQHCVGSEREV